MWVELKVIEFEMDESRRVDTSCCVGEYDVIGQFGEELSNSETYWITWSESANSTEMA